MKKQPERGGGRLRAFLYARHILISDIVQIFHRLADFAERRGLPRLAGGEGELITSAALSLLLFTVAVISFMIAALP